jgi:hypothetical protein
MRMLRCPRTAERPVDGIFGIVIEPKVIRQIDRLCIAAGDSETGGILIGRYTEDRSTAIIAEATRRRRTGDRDTRGSSEVSPV